MGTIHKRRYMMTMDPLAGPCRANKSFDETDPKKKAIVDHYF